jgi:putative (di)nucleoside polyphosphate hydrolase
MSKYRPNSALVLQKSGGLVLIAERINVPGAWQFPQGGAKKKESPVETLHREMKEELGLKPKFYEVLKTAGTFRYDFPPGFVKEGFVGQEQTYFLARLLDESLLPEGEFESEEFRAIRWIRPEDFDPQWIPEFKHRVYEAVMKEFFGLDWSAKVRTASKGTLQ